jgi:hypothetical protein
VSHAPMRDRLIALAGSTSQDPGGFLQGLSDIHFDWHMESPTVYGFLLFHTRVVGYFKAIVLPAVEPTIEPFTEQDFQDMGVQLFQDDPANADTLGGLPSFSTSIRSWHNTVRHRPFAEIRERLQSGLQRRRLALRDLTPWMRGNAATSRRRCRSPGGPLGPTLIGCCVG